MSEAHGNTADERTDAALVRAARRGDLTCFDELVRRHQRRATAVAMRLLSNRDEAIEIVQDAFLKSFEKLSSLQQPERFASWLLRIVGNLSLNRRRARALRRAAPLELAGDGEDRPEVARQDPRAESPLAVAAAKDLQGLIDQCLDELPEMQRAALVLFSIEQMPQRDVAEVLGCSVEAVKWHVFTARKKLKERLRDQL